MDAVHIPQLNRLPEQTASFEIAEHLPDLETLTPVQGSVKVSHRGTYLEVSGQAQTIITLTCHRCLSQYNHRLQVDANELIWLRSQSDVAGTAPLEEEIEFEDLVETLSSQGYFRPDQWIYEQLCLVIPPHQLCDEQCQGIALQDTSLTEAVDGRWSALEKLKRQMSS